MPTREISGTAIKEMADHVRAAQQILAVHEERLRCAAIARIYAALYPSEGLELTLAAIESGEAP